VVPIQGEQADRPARGLLRVPFVRRCALDYGDGRQSSGFVVNVNVLGAYVAVDDMPKMGETVTCRFRDPERDRDVTLQGTITWVNPRQQHPVHSLPPGFGLKLQPLAADDHRCIEQVVEDYLARNPQVAR
jgi:hypothetical protein